MTKTVVALLFVAVSAFAAQPAVFDRYEAVRQALLKNDVAAVQTAARELAVAAKTGPIVTHATQLAATKDIKSARASFATVSQDVIAYAKGVTGPKPVVVYCSMEKKSWLQPSASPITNPYVDAGMRACGEIVK